MRPITILIVSDIHAGHKVGLWPKGHAIKQNGPQRFLWKCWSEVLNQAVEERPQILVVNGDLIDGPQKKSGGSEAVTAVVGEQQAACVDILEPLARKVKEVYVTRGTPYHDGTLGADSEPIAQALGAVKTLGGEHTSMTWDLDIVGIRCNFHHEVPGGGGSLNRGSQLTKEMIYAHLDGPSVDLIVRSHLHYYSHHEFPNSHALITPAWELDTPFTLRKSPWRMRPDIGAVWVDLYPGERDPIRVRKQLFDLPVRRPVRSGV